VTVSLSLTEIEAEAIRAGTYEVVVGLAHDEELGPQLRRVLVKVDSLLLDVRIASAAAKGKAQGVAQAEFWRVLLLRLSDLGLAGAPLGGLEQYAALRFGEWQRTPTKDEAAEFASVVAADWQALMG
jgi:hypothetical protein